MLPVGGDGDGGAFESLTVENMKRFNEETPDVEGVRYFSWGAECEPGVLDTYRWVVFWFLEFICLFEIVELWFLIV